MCRLEVLNLVDNNISELPPFLCKLTKLHTLWYDCVCGLSLNSVMVCLCTYSLEGNLLREVDKVLKSMPSIRSEYYVTVCVVSVEVCLCMWYIRWSFTVSECSGKEVTELTHTFETTVYMIALYIETVL